MLPLSERQLQESLLQLLAYAYPQAFVFHVPNGGSRHPAEAARLKKQGVVSGVPDLIVVRPHGEVEWLELKSTKGTLRSTQREVHGILAARRQRVYLLRDVDQAASIIAEWKKEDRDREQAQ